MVLENLAYINGQTFLIVEIGLPTYIWSGWGLPHVSVGVACFSETYCIKGKNRIHICSLWASKLPEKGKGAELLISGVSFQSPSVRLGHCTSPGEMREQRG